jgi:ubiquinone/menaquinone biosynthesis C-methylase UbiE
MPRKPNPSRAAAILVAAIALLLSGCGALKRCAYEGFDRDAGQQPERVVTDLALAPGARVADLGAGGGYFAFRLARAVGPGGLVYAVDVDPEMVDFLAEQAVEQGLTQLRPVLASADDPHLPERVDLLFTSNTYHHLENRVAYFRALRERGLAAGGRIAIVEYRPEVTSHATARETIEQELKSAGSARNPSTTWSDNTSGCL